MRKAECLRKTSTKQEKTSERRLFVQMFSFMLALSFQCIESSGK